MPWQRPFIRIKNCSNEQRATLSILAALAIIFHKSKGNMIFWGETTMNTLYPAGVGFKDHKIIEIYGYLNKIMQ